MSESLQSNTAIDYQIPAEAFVLLKIYNIIGQEVVTLMNEPKAPGSYSVTWEGRDSKGCEVESGIYFYRLLTDDGRWAEIKSMILLR